MSSPKISVIGCGHWGKNLIRNFAELGALHAVADTNPDIAAVRAKSHDVEVTTFEEAIASDIEGIVIAAPAQAHADLAIKALEAGKHVYVEKPLALSLEDAQRVNATAKANDRVLMIGHLLQYHPVFAELREMVRDGALGPLRYVYSHRLSMGIFRTAEDAMWSLAPHDVSMILSLFGEEPDTVNISGQSFLTPGVADECRMDMVFPGGGRAHVFASWLHPFKEQRLVVVGETGMAVFDDTKPWGEKLALYRHTVDLSGDVPVATKADVQYIDVTFGEPLKAECQHFLDCIRTGAGPLTNAEEAIRVLRVVNTHTLPKPI